MPQIKKEGKMQKPQPKKSKGRTTFNYTKEARKIVEEENRKKQEKLDFEYKLVLSSLGIEVRR